MSKKKNYQELTTYDIYFVNIKTIMINKGISQNILSKMTGISINTIRSYYHSNIKRIDLDVVSRICKALDCKISDIIVLNWKNEDNLKSSFLFLIYSLMLVYLTMFFLLRDIWMCLFVFLWKSTINPTFS